MTVEREDEPRGRVAADPTAPPAPPVRLDRRKDDRQLRESEQRYRALVTATAQMIWTADAQGHTNPDIPTWCAYTGQSPEEAAGLGWLDAIHPDDRARTAAEWSRAVATGEVFETEYRVRRHDGIYRWFISRGVPVRNDDGEGTVREWIGACSDVTERKQAEAERLQSLAQERSARTEAETARARAEAQARQLNAIFEAVADGLFVFGRDGEVLQLNAEARRLFALDAPDAFYAAPMVERGYHTVVRDARGQPLPEQQWPFVRVLRGEVLTGAQAVDIMVRRHDGQERELNISGAPICGEDGQITGAVCVVRDVTERRRLERRTHQALDALLAMAQSVILTPDTTDQAGYPAAGQSAHEHTQAVGRRLAELTRHVLDCERVGIIAIEPETGIQHPIAAVGLSPEHEHTLVASMEGASMYDTPGDSPDPSLLPRIRAGEVVIIDMTRSPWHERPNPFGLRTVLVAPMRIGQDLVGILSLDYGGAEHTYTADETALAGAVAQLAALAIERERLLQKRAEAQSNALALHEANRRMDEFLSIASHELKTPLTSLKGSIQLAERRIARTMGGGPTEGGDLASVLTMVQGLLQRTGSQVDRMERLANDLVDVSRIQAGRLEMHMAPCDLTAIVRDAVEEQRLGVPARRIELDAPAGLKVTVLADADRIAQVVTNYLTNALKYSAADKPIVVGIEAQGMTARVWVRDEGPGIPPRDQEHIWERFYRAPDITYQSGSGVGLGMGLHISRTIVERHHGAVGVESAPGAGATFWFTLPPLG